MKAIKFLLLLSLPLLLYSCTRQYAITTNTYADNALIPEGFPHSSRFAISSPQKETPLLTKEISNKIAKILLQNGYEVTESHNADYLLSFSYGMTSDTHTVAVPTYIPGPSETTYGEIYSGGKTMVYREECCSPGTILYTPELVTLFTHSFEAQVFKLGATDPLWQGSCSCSSDNSDIRNVMDYLLVTSFKYFGQNTHQCLRLSLEEGDPCVKWLRGEAEKQ